MKKSLYMNLLTAAVLIALSFPSPAAQTEAWQKTVGFLAAETESADPAASTEPDLQSMSWDDYAISLDGVTLQFPLLFADCGLDGWDASDDLTTPLEPNQYNMFYFTKADRRMYLFIANFAQNTQPAEECVICGVGIDRFDWKEEDGEILLPGGIRRGISTLQEIERAYGTPSRTYEGDLYTQLTYETDIYETIELSVYRESGVLEDIEMKVLRKPDQFDPGEVSTEVPSAVSAYQEPEQLSTDPAASEIRVEDQVYTLPVPVSTLLSDGWKIQPEDSQASIAARSSGWVSLQKGGQHFRTLAANPTDSAVTPVNAWVTSLSIGKNDLDLDGALPGGITVGMSRSALEALFDRKGVSCEVEKNGDFIYYTYDKVSYDECKEVVVFTGTDGPYEADTVIKITCSKPE
ncbi:hypothetical protein [Porcincola intestinalis]|uniref:hypothetical protein n=1 Tax=Porcincola intestinalis TaxID=2606632 RepID=UPI0023F58856|nr:hypothetical protein [Porcincola intestinalis]MCI6766610.1 hypothetical protein [Lachnospiraceae bacterium]MDD7060891.1 hypothetical protein [Porcincola intestinalis]MDY5283321.1 hypothetical protein [Porcincola intestinalis]